MRLRTIFLGVALAICSRRTSAQSLDDLTAGVRVRVYGFEPSITGDRKYEATGQVATRDSAHLVIVRDGAGKFDTLPLFAVTQLQMNQGKTTRAKLIATGTAAGALGGTALWLIAKLLPLDNPSPATGTTNDLSNGGMAKTAKLAIPVLSVVGFAIGAFSDTDIWVNVRIPPSVYGR